jgi:hypothetical protein
LPFAYPDPVKHDEASLGAPLRRDQCSIDLGLAGRRDRIIS